MNVTNNDGSSGEPVDTDPNASAVDRKEINVAL